MTSTLNQFDKENMRQLSAEGRLGVNPDSWMTKAP